MMEAEDPSTPSQSSYRSERRKLDLQKRRLEIKRLTRSIWGQPAIVSPILIALLGLGAAYLTGWFDFRREYMRLDVERLTRERDSLQKDVGNIEGTLEESKCALGLLRWEKEMLRKLYEGRPGARDAVGSFLKEWKESGVPDAFDYFQNKTMVKWGFADDYDQIVSSGSDCLAKRPFVEVVDSLRIGSEVDGARTWQFIGKLSEPRPPVLIFILLWVRTPKEAEGEFSHWEAFPDLLRIGVTVEVKTPFTKFYSVGISQDEDVHAICRPVEGETTIQEVLVSRGLAVYFHGQSIAPLSLHQRLVVAQRKAVADGTGLWSKYPNEMLRLAETPPQYLPK